MTGVDALRLRGVNKMYGGGNREPRFDALRDVDLEIASGAFTTISGPSGAGKSTLLALLGLLDTQSSGHISVFGEDVPPEAASLRRRLRALHFGFVFQAFHLMSHRTVIDNTALGGLYRGMPREDRYREARDCLHRVGLAPKAMAAARTLSGGERQRAAIARALVGSPSVLLCDEPTGNLDSKNTVSVMKILGDLCQSGITLVVVTHDPVIASQGSQQVRVIDGNVALA